MALDTRMAGLSALALAALAGCAQAPAGPGAEAGTAPPGFQCPAAGTQIATSDGRMMNWLGTSPSDPFVCLVDTGGGQQRWLANLYSLPRADESAVRRGIAPLFPLTPGKTVSFIHEIFSPDGVIAWINSTWHVLGEQPMIIADTQRNVLVIENIESMPRINGYAGTWTYFYDPGLRVIVGGDLRVIRGFSNAQNWRATSITPPR